MSWIDKCYSRLLIDNHITDIKPEFMSRFQAKKYVEMVRLSGVECSMVYACDHNGNCYYPTQVGHAHNSLNGRDFFGETVALLKAEKIVPVAYYTVVYHNHSAKTHPQWRMRDIKGNEHGGRYHFSCANNEEYRAFCRAQIEEVIAYPVEGLFIDMTFWPFVCTCDSCRAKYRAETGEEIPEVIAWKNPAWVRFQRWRERSMAEFGAMLAAHVKMVRPDITVTHQFSPVLHGWFLGQCSGTALASDYASGDFYGGKEQQRIGTKIFAAYSKHQPYEFMTSRCVDLHDHTSTKSDDELFLHAVTTLANGGAFLFIDAINPDGTLNRAFYERLHKITKKLEPYRKMIQAHVPSLYAETGLYFSMSSCVNENLEGTSLRDDTSRGSNMDKRKNATVDEVTATAAILDRLHAPYRIITDLTTDYSGFKTIIVNNAAYLSPEECAHLREFVRNGGTLIATGKTSLYTQTGDSSGDFQLADVFGVSYTGRDAESISYLKTADELISVNGARAPLAEGKGAEVRGSVALPDFAPNDSDQYASIHSNPPGIDTEYVGLSVNRFGRGKCVWLYSALLMHGNHSQSSFGMKLFTPLLPQFVVESENLAQNVEVTLLRSSKNSTLILGMVNLQNELPVIPLRDVKVSVLLPEKFIPASVKDQSGANVKFEFKNSTLTIFMENLQEAVLLEIKEKEA